MRIPGITRSHQRPPGATRGHQGPPGAGNYWSDPAVKPFHRTFPAAPWRAAEVVLGGGGQRNIRNSAVGVGPEGPGGPRGLGDRGPKHLVRITEERVEGLGRRHVCVLVHSWGVFYFSCAAPPSQPVFLGVGGWGGVDSCGLVGAVRGGSQREAIRWKQSVMRLRTALILFSNSFYFFTPTAPPLPPQPLVFLKTSSCQELKQ